MGNHSLCFPAKYMDPLRTPSRSKCEFFLVRLFKKITWVFKRKCSSNLDLNSSHATRDIALFTSHWRSSSPYPPGPWGRALAPLGPLLCGEAPLPGVTPQPPGVSAGAGSVDLGRWNLVWLPPFLWVAEGTSCRRFGRSQVGGARAGPYLDREECKMERGPQ